MNKCKFFGCQNLDDLEAAVNAFLATLNYTRVMEVVTTLQSHVYGNGVCSYSASVVWYENHKS